jgi:hypothetical protein
METNEAQVTIAKNRCVPEQILHTEEAHILKFLYGLLIS